MRIGAALLLAALTSMWAIPCAGQPREDPCRTAGEETACFIAHEQEWLDVYGLATAASRVSAGTAMRRALFVDGYNRDLVAVEFIRTRGSGPVVAVYLPRREAASGIAEPALTAHLRQAEWSETTDRARLFDRRLMPDARRAGGERGAADETIWVCSHSWVYVVEFADPAADERDRLRRRAESACDGGLTKEYANFLADLAARLLPGCAELDRAMHGNSAWLLNVCARFSGDRLAAAEVYNILGELRGGGHSRQLPLLRRLFSRAILDWNGERIDRDVAEAWLARTATEEPASYFTERVHGVDSGRVDVDGFLERWVSAGENAPTVLWRAPVRTSWQRSAGETFAMERAAVGPFERIEGRCPPGLLTGAEAANDCVR